MRVTLLALLCLRAVEIQSSNTFSSVTHLKSQWITKIDSAGEAKTPSTTSTDKVQSFNANSASKEDALGNSKTTFIANMYPIKNTDPTIRDTESTMVTSTAIISPTEATLSNDTRVIDNTEKTSVTDRDFVTNIDASSIVNTMGRLSSNTGVYTVTEAILTTDTDPVTNTDSIPVSTGVITNTEPIWTTNTDLGSTSTAEQTSSTFYPITLSSGESHFTASSDLSTPSNTDPTELVHESLSSIFPNRFSVTTDPSKSSTSSITVESFTTTADRFSISPGLPTGSSSTFSTILTTQGQPPSANSSISTSDTWLSTATLSSTSFLPISSTSAESVSVSDITKSGEITVGSTPKSLTNPSSTTGVISDSPSLVVTDLPSTTSPSSLSTAITWNLTSINTESTLSGTAIPSAPPLSTTATISTTSSPPIKFQDPAIYNRTIEMLASILVGLQNLLNKIQNETQITRERRSTPDLDGETRDQADDEGKRSMVTPLFRVDHQRKLLGLESETENPSDSDHDSGTSVKPPVESPDISTKESSLCSSEVPPGDVCHELGTSLDATEEVLGRTQEKMQQLDAEILEQLKQRNADLEQLITPSDTNFSHVDSDKAKKKIESVMQRASDVKMEAEEVLDHITSSPPDQSWVYVYALAGAVAAAVLLLLAVLVGFCRRRQSKPASTMGYEEAHGLSHEVDRFHGRLSCENDGMSLSTNRSESLSSFQDHRRQTPPDQINSQQTDPRKSGKQNPISLYPQTRKDPSRDTIHLEVGNNQSYIHVTAALSSRTSAWGSDRVTDVRDLRRGYPNLPLGTRVQSRPVSRSGREVALYRGDDGNNHLSHPSRYSAWDDEYYPSIRRDHSGRQEHTSTGQMGDYGHEPRSCGLLKPIYLQGPSVVGKIPRARC